MTRALQRVAFLFLCACAGGTETGNPPFAAQLSYNAYSSDTTVAALTQDPGTDASDAAQATGDTLRIDSAWIVLGDVRFVSSTRCAEPDAVPVHAEGIGVGDHAAPGAVSSTFELEGRDYCGLQLPLRRGTEAELPEGAPASLSGRSILLTGELPDGRAFELSSDVQRVLFLQATAERFEMSPDRSQVLLGFDVATWLLGIDLSAVPADQDGLVRVSTDAHPELARQLDDNLAAGVDLFRDPQGRGVVAGTSERLASGTD